MKILTILLLMTTSALGVYTYSGQWGTEGSGKGQLEQPTEVSIADNGNVYVADCGNFRVQYFNSIGRYYGQWGTGYSPAGIAVINRLTYTTESRGYLVSYFNIRGIKVGEWGSFGTGEGELNNPEGVAVAFDMDGVSYVYVADSNNHRIQYFTQTGEYVGQWGTQGTGNGEFWFPTGIAIGPNRYVYVADYSNQRIQYFTPTGSYLGKWGSQGEGDGQFYCPRSVAVDSRGRVFVADFLNYRIQYFTPTGEFLGKWGKKGTGDGEFDKPCGIAVDSGRVYVADTWNDRIQYFDYQPSNIQPSSVGEIKALYR